MPESIYESDPATSPVSIHPYPKQHGHSGRAADTLSADEEARLEPTAESRLRYEDFFDDGDASQSA